MDISNEIPEKLIAFVDHRVTELTPTKQSFEDIFSQSNHRDVDVNLEINQSDVEIASNKALAQLPGNYFAHVELSQNINNRLLGSTTLILSDSPAAPEFRENQTLIYSNFVLSEGYTYLTPVISTININTSTSKTDSLSVRLMEFGAIGNGYLSYFHSNSKAISAFINSHKQIKNVPLPFAEMQNNYLQNNSFDRGHAVKSVGDINLNHTSLRVNGVKNQLTTENVKLISAVQPKEYTKNNLLITDNELGRTIWFRDYGVNVEQKLSIKENIINSQYVKENHINRIFINGELLWQRKEYQK
ncbi:hypothetical protein [Flocculibacter collagenilyticus]|uniref:hypothetical protein n=1 Tax=Flocculibacter collagenilyticus TaxID=2744479 RepID=UPI0018F776BA|nr:hypothetical protein [Flocculibacter collagenilyticus]